MVSRAVNQQKRDLRIKWLCTGQKLAIFMEKWFFVPLKAAQTAKTMENPKSEILALGPKDAGA